MLPIADPGCMSPARKRVRAPIGSPIEAITQSALTQAIAADNEENQFRGPLDLADSFPSTSIHDHGPMSISNGIAMCNSSNGGQPLRLMGNVDGFAAMTATVDLMASNSSWKHQAPIDDWLSQQSVLRQRTDTAEALSSVEKLERLVTLRSSLVNPFLQQMKNPAEKHFGLNFQDDSYNIGLPATPLSKSVSSINHDQSFTTPSSGQLRLKHTPWATIPSTVHTANSNRTKQPPITTTTLYLTAFQEWPRYVADFEEIEKLGEGTFASVYCVRHRLEGRLYAIKKSRNRVEGCITADIIQGPPPTASQSLLDNSSSRIAYSAPSLSNFTPTDSINRYHHHNNSGVSSTVIAQEIASIQISSHPLLPTPPERSTPKEPVTLNEPHSDSVSMPPISTAGSSDTASDDSFEAHVRQQLQRFYADPAARVDTSNPLHEVWAYSALRGCPHLVEYYSSWIEDRRLYMQLELCDLGTLDDLISDSARSSVLQRTYNMLLAARSGQSVAEISHYRNRSDSCVSVLSGPSELSAVLQQAYSTPQSNSNPQFHSPPVSGGSFSPPHAAVVIAEGIVEPLAWLILFRVSETLEFMHKRGMVHMDIRPANLLLQTSSEFNFEDDSTFPKLLEATFSMDFNQTMCYLHHEVQQHIIEQKYIIRVGDLGHSRGVHEPSPVEEGESRYCPRELIDSDQYPVDLCKADIFSLGATVYELCLGRKLGASGQEGLIEWHSLRDGLLDASLSSKYSPSLVSMLHSMLHPNPTMRPSATEVISQAKNMFYCSVSINVEDSHITETDSQKTVTQLKELLREQQLLVQQLLSEKKALQHMLDSTNNSS